MNKYFSVFITLLISVSSTIGNPSSSAEIRQALKKLNVLGSFLYIAAHPDDENTRLIAYMANEKLVETAYLSLTRGDGGQNLIGTEKGELMGLLRTQELLEARKIDGGKQFFTRAVDFGYSKTPEETFSKWDKQKVLADVVWAIRKFKPDVLVTRFPTTSYAGHGHHSASAILAEEAFDMAADPKAFPEQLKFVETWQPKRLYFNSSSWWDKELEEKAKNSQDYITVDVGSYNTFKGKSYSEISAESRSMHKSQGFGSAKERGTKIEYLQYVKGNKAKNNLFDEVDITWNKVKNGKVIAQLIDSLYTSFNDLEPEKSVAGLLKVHQLIEKTENAHWKKVKLKEIEDLLLACSGLWIESTADDFSAAQGHAVNVTSSLVNRSNNNITINKITVGSKDSTINKALTNNELIELKNIITTPNKISSPYWLNHPFDGVFKVDEQELISNPENEPAVATTFYLTIGNVPVVVKRPLVYKWTDRVKGELYRPFVVLPNITANLEDQVYIFSNSTPKSLRITLKAHKKDIAGKVSLKLPEGWSSNPVSVPYQLKNKNEEQIISIAITPPKKESLGEVEVILESAGKSYVTIDYDHIPIQTLLPDAKAKIVRLDVETKGTKLGYIAGAGDEVPKGLQQLGYEVTMITETDVIDGNLQQYDAVLSGIRAYNTQEFLKHYNHKLLEYVEGGGCYIVQYNTNRGLVTEDIGPYPFKLSRDRITVEEAEVKFIAPKHILLNKPNKIIAKDFDGWVQERGLYFPNEWDKKYTPLLEWSDPGEDPVQGALLVAHHGEGSFIYTGISFFRELPAGVPGAFKLLANIISYSKEKNGRNEK